MLSKDKMSLKTFWDAVERRLASSSADELRSILRAMAQETLPAQREAFLAKLKPVADIAADADRVIGSEDLLADIDDLAAEIREAMQESEPPEDEYDDWYYDDYGEHEAEDSLGPYEQFIEPLTALFDRAEAAFDYGDLKLARAAYQKLFEIFDQEDDYGRSISLNDLSVDGDEAIARYLRAVYETEPLKRRPQKLFEQMLGTRSRIGGEPARLKDVIEISPKPLPDQEPFIENWIAYLREQSGSEADAWLREAVRLSRGAAGMEELARQEGKKRPRAYLDWFAALEGEGKHQEVLTAAQEALEKLPAKLPIRAAIADHLCAAALQLQDTDALRAGRWEAFLVKPTLARLLDVWEAAPNDKERANVMRQAVEHLQNYIAHPPRQRDTMEWDWRSDDLEQAPWINKAVLAHARLLAGDWSAAHETAAREKVLGWSSSDSTQGLVVPFFLVLLSGKSPNALPANLAQQWRAALQNSVGFGYYGESDESESDVMKRLQRVYADRLSSVSMSSSQQKTLLAWCLDVANQRVDAIVGGQHRGSYGKAAVLTAACAETLQLRGQDEQANAVLDDARNRFPRHRAFLAELDMAMQRMGHSSKRKK